ncbi:MAG: flagellar basal-body rod protein FlgF [Thermodesulfobacteriota bacterium]|nr:flagellar basal-body rod protein FlgF [Thermodesulfobacteriota bacterium]
MDPGVFMISSGAIAQEKRFEILTNNLANVNTVGYKGDKTAFSTFVQSFLYEDKTFNDKPIFMHNSQVFLEEVKTDFSAGKIRKTGNPLDLAIGKEGFFVINTPERKGYTRQGIFTKNKDDFLVTLDGNMVLGEKGKVALDGKDILISQGGEVVVDGKLIDRLKIVDFSDKNRLRKLNDSFFVPVSSGIKPEKVKDPMVYQGFLEHSNVNPIESMVRMIEIQRTYESYQKIIQAIQEITERSVNDVGRIV